MTFSRVALALLLMLAACSSSHHADPDAKLPYGIYYQGDGPFPRVSEEEFPSRLAEVQAREDERCCQRAELPSRGVYDSVFASLEESFSANSIDPASGARFDPAAAAACIARREARDCPTSKQVSIAEDACNFVYKRGERRIGEPCSADWDCAAPAHDARVGCQAYSRSDSVCTLYSALGEGADCSDPDPDKQCSWGLWCDPERSKCVRPARLGEPCLTGPSLGDTCERGAVCDRRNTKRCVKPKTVGAACSELEECEWLACVDGSCREPWISISICPTR